MNNNNNYYYYYINVEKFETVIGKERNKAFLVFSRGDVALTRRPFKRRKIGTACIILAVYLDNVLPRVGSHLLK